MQFDAPIVRKKLEENLSAFDVNKLTFIEK